jgi:hypothetical protein
VALFLPADHLKRLTWVSWWLLLFVNLCFWEKSSNRGRYIYWKKPILWFTWWYREVNKSPGERERGDGRKKEKKEEEEGVKVGGKRRREISPWRYIFIPKLHNISL